MTTLKRYNSHTHMYTHTHIAQVLGQCSHLETSLHTLTPSQVGVAKTKLDHTLQISLIEGEHLLECYQKSPGNQAGSNLTSLLEELKQRTEAINILLDTVVRGKNSISDISKGTTTPVSVARGSGVGGESPSTAAKVHKKYTDLYAELEEQAYKVCERNLY